MSKKNEIAEVQNETALAVAEPAQESRFLALRSGGPVAEAFQANFAEGDGIQIGDLTMLKVPAGGATTWEFEDMSGVVTAREITGAIVAYQPYGILWPTEKSVEGAHPFMVTHDLKIGHRRSDDYGDLDPEGIEACRLPDGTYDWQKLPQNQWGSGKGRGKRCKEQRIICILRDEDTLPLMLRVPPASLQNVTRFIKKLSVPFFRCVVKLTLEKADGPDGPYARVKPAFVEALSPEEGLRIKRLYTDSLITAIREAAESPMEFAGAQDDLE